MFSFSHFLYYFYVIYDYICFLGCKDSLTSFGSNSTLTGREIDDSHRISRVQQSVRQKEEFLRTPLREFHGRPKKFEGPVWPPNEPPIRQESSTIRQDSPGRGSTRQMHHNVRRVKNDYDNGTSVSPYSGDMRGGMANMATPTNNAHSPRDTKVQQEGVREAEVAPSFHDEDVGEMARESTADDRR